MACTFKPNESSDSTGELTKRRPTFIIRLKGKIRRSVCTSEDMILLNINKHEKYAMVRNDDNQSDSITGTFGISHVIHGQRTDNENRQT